MSSNILPTATATAATLQLSLNPEIVNLPERFPRYRHGSHKHRLACDKGSHGHHCDNRSCSVEISPNATRFCCRSCDYDLCARCFCLPATSEVPLENDHLINDRILPHNLVDLFVVSHSNSDDDDDDSNIIHTSYQDMPAVPEIDRVCPICYRNIQLVQLHCLHVCCYSCYLNLINCHSCRTHINRALTKKLPVLDPVVVETDSSLPTVESSTEPLNSELSESTHLEIE